MSYKYLISKYLVIYHYIEIFDGNCSCLYFSMSPIILAYIDLLLRIYLEEQLY